MIDYILVASYTSVGLFLFFKINQEYEKLNNLKVLLHNTNQFLKDHPTGDLADVEVSSTFLQRIKVVSSPIYVDHRFMNRQEYSNLVNEIHKQERYYIKYAPYLFIVAGLVALHTLFHQI